MTHLKARRWRWPVQLLVALFVLCALSVAQAAPKTSWGQIVRKVRRELQVYRGRPLERISDRWAAGRSTFDPKASVAKNLEKLVAQKKLQSYVATLGGRKVLHVVVDLAKGKQSAQALRAIHARVAGQTIELNYKAASPTNTTGHVAVRVGSGALYDLTGTRGAVEMPPLLTKVLTFLRGRSDLSFARRRNLRRFMESRKDRKDTHQGLYYGLLFAATPQEQQTTRAVYEGRLKSLAGFAIGGGDSAKGIYSCAQFLSEKVPFFNERGVQRTIGARSMVSSCKSSQKLEAVIVYRMPGVDDAAIQQKL